MTKWLMTNLNHHNQPKNKNAFQWDAYRPLVDRITACTGQGGVSAGGGVCLPGGCLPGGLNYWVILDPPEDQRQTSPLWTDRHL